MDHFSRLNRAGMFFHRCLIPVMLIACFFVRTINSIQRCGRDLCRDDQICCAQGNDTTITCCKQLLDKTYYNIAMVTRKLSGVLILLLLFAVGYFIHRALCSKSRQLTPPPNIQPTATTSQEPLVERCCTPKNFTDPGAAAQLPTYEECKRLPTYEETVREGSSGQLESSI